MVNANKKETKKNILIVNCYFDPLRLPVQRRLKIPQPMTPAYLAGVFSSTRCNILLYDEVFSGPLENEKLLSFPDMLVLTGLNVAFDRMLHLTAYVKTKNSKAIVVAGGPAIRALPRYSERFFDYSCTGDIEQLSEVIESVYGKDYISGVFLEKGWVSPRFDLVYWTKLLTYVESSRNCYFRCNYCSLTAEKGSYQSYELDYIEHQIKKLGKKNLIHFIDNNFASKDKQFITDRFRILEQYHKKGYILKWAAEVTSDFFLDDDNIERSANSGCGGLFCGIESFDNQAIAYFRKYQNTLMPQIKVIEKCLKANIPFHYGIVFDLTTRTIEDLKNEFDFILETPEIPLPSFITLAIPLLKTPLFNESVKKGRFLPNLKIRDLDGSTITLKPQNTISDAVKFLKDITKLNGYRKKVLKHLKIFSQRYKQVLSIENLVMTQYGAFVLWAPKLSTLTYGPARLRGNHCRTFVGTTEHLDSVYQPAFTVESRFGHYFKPTMLTDGAGNIQDDLVPDLLE